MTNATYARLISPAQLAVAVHAYLGLDELHVYDSPACAPACRASVESMVDRLYAALPPNEGAPMDVRVDRRDEIYREMSGARVALVRLTGDRVPLTDGVALTFSLLDNGAGDTGVLVRMLTGYTAVNLAPGTWILRRLRESEEARLVAVE